ncbi:unnamed protein product [Cercopithifilaria johnstoni]|uniref:Uncharacterized protein n=1 Tax=Cercopithifilaria johnstoni TaxID=2874296 RepID=A0A8J2PXM5_9BILA|nr:unnamed protein product [Cercopithifilaria johnstoni]
MNVVKRIPEKEILGHIPGDFDLSKTNGTIHNYSVNSNDISTAKLTFTDVDSLSSTADHIPNSNLSMTDLKADRSDERKFDIPTNTTTSSLGRCVMPQSTVDSLVGHIPSSYHYRIPTYTDPNTASQQTPPYMIPTISSAMKMKQIIKQCTPSESLLWTYRRRHSISEGLHTAASFTPSRNRGSYQSRLRLWQQVISQPLPKICRKEPKAELLTTGCDIANGLNHQNLRRTSSQPLLRVTRRSSHCGGLYHNYLKQLYWDRITSKYDKISRTEHFMKEDQQRTADLAPMNVDENAQNEISSVHLGQAHLQLSPRNSYQERNSRFYLGRDYLQQQDQVDNDASTPSLCTAQVKTPCGWQRTFSRVPCKISRFDRFAFVETISVQVWITEAPLSQSSSKTARYNVWQWTSSNSLQKVSRLKRFRKSEIKDTKSQCISQLEQSAEQFILRESKGLETIWKRTFSKSLPKISRIDRFSVPGNSVVNICRGNLRPEQLDGEVSLDFLATQSSLSNALKSPATSPNPLQRSLFYEQAKLMPLREVSSSSLHTAQLRSLKTSLIESLSSEELPEKHSNLTIKPLCRNTSSECFEKNVALCLRESETRSSKGSILPDIIFYDGSLWRRSKSILQRISRFERFQKRTLSTSSTASTKSFEALPTSKALFSRVSAKKRSKISKLLRRTRFDRFQKNILSILNTARTNSLLVSTLPDTSSFERSSSESKSSCILLSRYLPSPCIWNRLTAEPIQRNSRIERFQNSALLDLHTAPTRPSSSSLFSDISLILSSEGCLWEQTKAMSSKKFHRYYPNFDEVTMNTSDSYQKEKMLDRNSRFNRFQNNFSPNSYTTQSTFSQNLSTKRFLKKETEQGIPRKISHEKHFKTDYMASELMAQVSGAKYCPYDNRSLCNGFPMYSLLIAQQRSPEQSLTCCSLDNIDSCKDIYLTDSTTEIVDFDRNKKLEREISYEEQYENRAPTILNMFNGIRNERSDGLWDRTAIQQTQEVSHLSRTERQHFDGE